MTLYFDNSMKETKLYPLLDITKTFIVLCFDGITICQTTKSSEMGTAFREYRRITKSLRSFNTTLYFENINVRLLKFVEHSARDYASNTL